MDAAMNLLLDFFLAHWVLTAIFLTLLGFYIAVEVFYSQKDNKISPQFAVDLINHQHAVVIDIRSQELFADGHIIDSINLPFATAGDHYKKIQKYLKKPIILVGVNHKDLTKITTELTQQNFQQVLQLAGGIQEWVANGLPVTSNKSKQ